MRETFVNGRWPVILPDHRAARPEWPWHEAARFAAMYHHLAPHMLAAAPPELIFDVGAEEGDHAAVFASWGCDVFLIEPNTRVWPCIAAVVTNNPGMADRVAGWWWGFAGSPGERPPSAYGSRFGRDARQWPSAAYGPIRADHGMAHLNVDKDVLDGGQDEQHPTVSIDELAAALGRPPTALTIDVEGAELLVLRGALQTLTDHRPKVWVSVHREYMENFYGHDPDDLFAYMAGLGYQATFLATDHESHWQFLPEPS